MDLVKTLQKTLDDHIPLIRSLDAKVVSYVGQTLEIALPLEPNINHKHTAFGGSLYCGAVLSAWGLLYLKLLEAKEEGVIVIFDGRMHYHKPVTTHFISTCQQYDTVAWGRFLKVYQRMGISRITLNADIVCDGDVCARFTGEFVVQKE